MKKLAYFLFLLIGFQEKNLSQSNVYHPFPDSNAVWCEGSWGTDFSGPVCIVYDNYQLYINGDTVVGTKQYNKLYANGHVYSSNCGGTGTYYNNKYRGGIRNDTTLKQTFLLDENGNDNLFFDYNWTTGDTIYNLGGNIITKTDSVLAGSSYRKRFWLSILGSTFPSDSNYATMIDGVGSTKGLLHCCFADFEAGAYFHSFSQNGQLVYDYDSAGSCSTLFIEQNTNKTGLLLFPNPSQGTFTIDFGKQVKEVQLEITDLLGKIILLRQFYSQSKIEIVNLPAGVYTLSIKDNTGLIVKRKVISEP